MIKILLAGEGGQGIQTAGEILAKTALKVGKKVLYIPNFGVEQRGGVSLAFLVIDEKQVVYPKFEKADFLAIFSERSVERVNDYYNSDTKLILTPAVTSDLQNKTNILRLGEDFPQKAWNVLVMANIVKITNLAEKKILAESIQDRFGRAFAKDPTLESLDFKALDSVME